MPINQTIETDYGLASVYDADDGGRIIEINRKLSGELKEEILKHEQRHGTGRYNLEDFKNDFQAKQSHFKRAFYFALQNPESLIGYFPIMYSYFFKIFTWNTAALYPFLLLGLIFSLFFFFLFHINFFLAFLGWMCIFTTINLILLLTTHFYVKKQEAIRAKKKS